jgi:hypothetical protein
MNKELYEEIESFVYERLFEEMKDICNIKVEMTTIDGDKEIVEYVWKSREC